MTSEEALKTIALAGIYFPNRIPAETARVWALEIEDFDYVDAQAGVRRMARTQSHPSLETLLESVKLERADRRRREQPRVHAVHHLTSEASADSEQALRNSIGKQLAIDIALRKVPPETMFEIEFSRRLMAARAARAAEESPK